MRSTTTPPTSATALALGFATLLSVPSLTEASTTVAAAAPAAATTPADATSFARWKQAFAQRASDAGIPQATLKRSLPHMQWLPDVVERDRNQGEFTRAIWDYLASAVSTERVENGRKALARHSALLAQIEARYRVEREVVLAIWGLETAYGTFRGKTNVLAALATLAHEGRRARFFEDELINALRIIAAGDIPPEAMIGSWAGAMGHTQFMPSSYLALAQDFNADGRRDIWSNDPADGLASAAHYLAHHGWQQGQPWGLEVSLPQGFDYSQSSEAVRHPSSHWASLGVKAINGAALPAHDEVSLLLPAGAKGTAFLVYPNYHVIKRYNPAMAYAIGVGHLSDRINGAGGLQGPWPEGERALTKAERIELQENLTALGYDPQGTDGRIGPKTIAAIRALQTEQGSVPDGFAGAALLELSRKLRR